MGKKDDKAPAGKGGNLGGILGGLAEILEKLGDLADKGIELSSSSELGSGEKAKDVKGVYGFSVKFGLGGDAPKVEPFGNIRKDERTGHSVVHEIREPIVDLFEEDDHILIVAELPGVSTEDIRIEVEEDILTLVAERKDRKYRKEILLPRACCSDNMTYSCNSGVFELRLQYRQKDRK